MSMNGTKANSTFRQSPQGGQKRKSRLSGFSLRAQARPVLAAAIGGLVLLGAARANATSKFWIGTEAQPYWNWNYNWWPNGGAADGDILNFGDNALLINTNSSITWLLEIWFKKGNSGTTSPAFTLNGNPVSLNKVEVNDNTSAQTVNIGITARAEATSLELNPVTANLTMNGNINNNGKWIDVYGASQKTLTINGVLSGTGGLSVKQDSIVALTNNNSFSGAVWVEKGTVQPSVHSNALGTSGTVNVGTNATLNLAYGSMTIRPATLNLYGTGTNSTWGALRKATASAATWRGIVNVGADSRIVASAGNIHFSSNIVIGAYTLYVTNANAMNMSGGEMTGGKTTGDGAFYKTGNGAFLLRPGSGLTGSVALAQGDIRQGAGSDLPAGGMLTMANGTRYASDGNSARTVQKAVTINGSVEFGASSTTTGSLTIASSVNLAGAMRQVTVALPAPKTATFSGAITNGGLTKAGAGTMILSGANTYALGTLISAGTLEGTTTSLQGNLTNNSALVFNQAGAGTYAGAISGTGALTNSGTGAVTLTGASSMSGNTALDAGVLIQNGTNVASAVSVGASAYLYGTGSNGAVTITGQASAGNGSNTVGNLKATALTLPNNGRMQVNISAMTGTAGTHWDVITLGSGGGTYTVSASDGTDFVIALKGSPALDPATAYALKIVDAGTATGFDAAKFTIDTNEFTSPLGGGVFSVDATDGDLRLVFTPPAPAVPTGLTASDGASTSHVSNNWSDVAGETGYVIWRYPSDEPASATAIFTNAANATNYLDTSASPGQTYFYWVSATNSSGSSAKSSADSGYRKLATVSITAATDGVHLDKVALTWTDIDGETGYGIWRDTDGDPAGGGWLGTAAADATSYDDSTATPGQQYTYWVRATNSSSASQSDFQGSGEGGYVKLAAVALTAASDDQTTGVTVTWADVTGETGYGLWRAASSDTATAVCVTTAVANATSQEDTTAVAGTTYYYWVRATNSTSASMGEFSNSDTGLRVLTEPTAAASNLVFSAITTDAMTVGWQSGNGNFALVVAKQGSAPADPSDSTVYGADEVFGVGDQTAAGSYVVYKGTDTTVRVTSLPAPATEYYFAVYEFNGADTPNYLTNDAPVASRFTVMTEPTLQSSNILVSTINMASLYFNWTPGNGNGRLVVMKAGGPVSVFPTDGATNAFTATFGTGYAHLGDGNYAVYAGAGTNVDVTGLANDTVYHIRVFEYRGTNTTINYYTNAAALNPISQTTMAANPGSNPSDLTISAIGTHAFTVTWTKGTTGTNTLIVIRAGGNPADPSDLTSYAADATFGSGSDLGSSSYVVYNGTGSSVTVTNLTPGASYTVDASSFNGSGGSENYRGTPTSTSASTQMPEPSQATGLAFGTLADTSYAVSYTAGDGLSRLVVARVGSAVDWFPADGTAYSNENNDIGSATNLGGTGNFLVHKGASPFTLSGLTAASNYYLRIYEYQGTNATLNYNTNAASGNPSNRYALSAEPTAHGTLAATALSDTNIGLSWGDATGESGYLLVRQTADSGWTAPADGTAYSVGAGLGGTIVYVGTAAGAGATTDTLLSASTPYYYKIYPYAYDGTPAHATYNYYVGGTPGNASATTGPAEPATSSTLTSFLPASGASATIVWTNTGAADGSIILMKSGGAVSSNPADWTNYLASLTFPSGDQIGAGNYVVVTGAFKHGTATVTGLTAGTTYHVAVYPYNGSGAFLNYRTASPATGSATILPDPTAAAATADGKTMVRLAWMTNATYNTVMIVHRAGSASTAPTQGAEYLPGAACGDGTVIYKGSGTNLEHVVAPGTTHHYAFYSYSGNYYSAGVATNASPPAFAAGEVVETFSYTNSTALTGLNGSNGWGGAWYGDTALFTNSAGSFTTQTNYPANSGNKLWVYPPDDTGKAVFRPLGQEYKSGKIYFGYILNYTWEGANKYAGLSLFTTNTTERLFIGEIYGQDRQLGIDNTGSAVTLTNGVGNDYIIVGYYDWGAGEAKAKAYRIGSAVPTTEPGAWDVTVSKASNDVGTVNTIRLAAGAGASDGTPGNTYFDEVRVATSWGDLIGQLPTKPLDPTGQTATEDGSEMARLAWAKNGDGDPVMILHNTTAIATDPTDGVSYGVGEAVGGATVVYQSTGTAVEHVVQPGTTNYYKFYSYNGANYYSTGVVATVTNGAYASYEKVNPFSYTNATVLGAAAMGGQGFGANYWAADSGTWTVQTNYATAVVDSVPKFVNMSNYPGMAGNLVVASDPGNGGSAQAQRSLESSISTGTFYIAFMMSYQYRGADKWAGVSLFNGATEKAFFGKGAGANWSTLGVGDGTTTFWSAFDMGEFDSDTGNTGNVYLVAGKYDFSSKQLGAKAYRILDGAAFPASEPAWDVTTTLGTGIDSIDRIKLNVGSADAGNTIGKVFFDEIRYATNWAGLIAVTCPAWVGSNTINNVAWTAASNTWLGDTENFQFQSSPPGPGQAAGIEFDWARDGSFSSYFDTLWWQNANDRSYWTNQVQMTAAGVVTSRFVATGSSCGAFQTNNPALNVQNLNPPVATLAAADAVNTNSQINLEWTRGVSGAAKDTLVVRKAGSAPTGIPANGATYNAGDALGDGTVVYRGAETNYHDTGLAASTTYHYRFFAENGTYYSATYAVTNATTAAGGQTIVIDGNPADWAGTPSTVLDSSASSLQQFIWTDKTGEVRTDHGDHPNADLAEFRVFADADWVYFLVKMTNITDVAKPYVAIGVDTRTNSASGALNWLGDDANTFIGDGYAQGAAAHYPEFQINVHHIDATTRIELYAQDGNVWYAPPTGGNTNVAISAANKAIELKVARADLNLTGAKTARFTVASYLNSGVWNNDGAGTLNLTDGTARAADALSIPPWNAPDNSATMSAWLEDLSDADVDFWLDVKFGEAGLSDNSRPTTPALVSPTNTAATTASPNLSWNAATDADGQITGYLLEISTNEQFNGVTGTENGTVDLRVHLNAATTNYVFSTIATQYWWRVRSRDTAGELSTATTRFFRVVGKLDTEGPRPTLLYIGTNVAGYLAGDADITNRIAQYGPIQSVLDSEIRDTNNVFGFVLRWEDASGVYATNRTHAELSGGPGEGQFAFNIVDGNGRVSPNWDLVEIDTAGGTTNEWGKDLPFYASNTLATGNSDVAMTNYVRAAFTMTNYNPAIEYYLTVSAEDAYITDGSWAGYGSWASYTNASGGKYYSGWCKDGPNTARNITTNFLIRIQVTDDDAISPVASKALAWDNEASLVVSNATSRLDYDSGTGQDVLYQITDGALINQPLSFSFNAYDSYYKGVALGTDTTFTASGRTLTNSAFVAAYWQTNWANYDATKSLVADTTAAGTMVTWHWDSITTQDVTRLWGPDSLSGDLGVTNLIQLDLFDVDNDRDGDQASARVNFGRVVLVDDDAVDPVVSNETLQVTGTGLATEYVLANLVEWQFTGAAAADRVIPTTVAGGVTSSVITLINVGGSSTIGGQGGTNIGVTTAFYNTNYSRAWQFTVVSTNTKTFLITSLSFESRVSTLNGPDTWELWGKTNETAEGLWASGTFDLSDPDNAIATNWNSYGTSVTMPGAATNATFRLVAYVADTNHLTESPANSTWYIDNLIASGHLLGEGGGTQVTDRDLARGTARFQAVMHDAYSGLYATTNEGRAPRVDFWHAGGVPVTNGFFTNGLASNGAAKVATTNWGFAPPADKKTIQGGRAPTNYTARFLVNDFDVDRDGDSRVVTNTLAVAVYDNDTNAPVRGFKFGGPLGVFVDGALTKAVSSGYTREYRINDEQLQGATATSITVKVNLYDFSGWTVPALSVSNAVAGVMTTNPWLSSLLTDAVDTTNKPEAEMVWTLSKTQADAFFNDYESTVNVFRVSSVWDKDDDRQDAAGNNIDGKELADSRLGGLTFIDNDVGMANVQSNYSEARTNWSVPRVFLGLPGDATRSNLLINGDTVLDTNASLSAVLANLTNRVYDSQLAKVASSAPLSVVLPAFDTGGGGGGRTVKGVLRGTNSTESSTNGSEHVITNSWVNIGTVKVQNASAFRIDLSSPLAHTKIAAQFPTSTWAFTSFSYGDVGQWLNAGQAASNHLMTAGLYDADDNRPNDQTFRQVPIGTLQVLDNDTVAPVAPTNLKVNGAAATEVLTRATASWTNQADFRISFKPAVDGEPAGTDLEKTGVAEHRVAAAKAGVGPDLGTPLAVPAEGALANYGFENGSNSWTLTGAVVTNEQAYEGTNSLKMLGSTARQTIRLFNTNGYEPRVAVQGARFMGAATVTGAVTVAGLDAGGTPIGGFDVSIVGTAGQWVGAVATSNTLATTVDRVQVTLTSGAGTYWDDIQIQIELLNAGTPVEEVTALFTATAQGLTTNYLFAVDRDNNRPADRMASSDSGDAYIPAFGIAYDLTPPTAVPVGIASTENVGDPTSQFDIEWNPAAVGPDDTADSRHPDFPFAADRDKLSPWRTYKIYYGPFDPLNVPGDDDGPGFYDAYIHTNFIVTGAYSNSPEWKSVTSTNAVADPSAATNYHALTNLTQAGIRLFDLDFDQDYAVVVVGVDKAGNEGPAGVASWATNNTIKFAVTQGLLRTRAQVLSAFPANNNLGDRASAAGLYWIAAGPTNAGGGYEQVNKDYDLIYHDTNSFNESSNSIWHKVGTIRTNWFTDAEGQDHGRGTVRFYRASYKDRWQRTDPQTGQPRRPLASEDVYALHNVILSEGFNHVGLHGEPYVNSFLGVFGADTNFWPAASSPANATKIEFYSAGPNAPVSDVYYFGLDGETANWYLSGNATPVTTNLQASNFFTRGFSITLPTNLQARGYATTTAYDANRGSNLAAMVWHPILKVPTNGPGGGHFSHVIHCGEQSRPEVRVYNVVALNLPVSVHPSALNLPANFRRGDKSVADQIYTMDTSTKTIRDNPSGNGSMLYCDAANEWRYVNGDTSVTGPYFKPNDVIVIVSRNGGTNNTWTWTYHPTNFYALPTRTMGQ
ncbi:MAG: hypothetical protein EOM72_03925 [Opitutae bacterium]|nr:hypothetical protein [Opitutae bacterium]